ncbi:MAG: GNAT family N-acetyltransferase [Thermomicrobiales bacterium]|nr:GNAT family N-acetyltransferase [Thermomicrobiales bacterium]
MSVQLRRLAVDDYDTVIGAVDEWWGGRPMAVMLPRFFFAHFQPTSFAAEEDGRLLGFLVGFRSQTEPAQAYIHFVGVDPAARGRDIGRRLYERFFATACDLGCREVLAVTAPINSGSIAFHARMGFAPLPGLATTPAGVPYTLDYDGPREDRVRFRRTLPDPGGE